MGLLQITLTIFTRLFSIISIGYITSHILWLSLLRRKKKRCRKMWRYCIKLGLMHTDSQSHGRGSCLVSYLNVLSSSSLKIIHTWKLCFSLSAKIYEFFSCLGGNLKGGINQAGIDYYNNLINELLSKGKRHNLIQAKVTLSVSYDFKLSF
jgi:hypothetical protein